MQIWPTRIPQAAREAMSPKPIPVVTLHPLLQYANRNRPVRRRLIDQMRTGAERLVYDAVMPDPSEASSCAVGAARTHAQKDRYRAVLVSGILQ